MKKILIQFDTDAQPSTFDRVVAVDATSQFPESALKEKKNVGYMRALSTEGCLSVDPTVILASERSGPAEVVKSLKTTSVPYVEIPDQHLLRLFSLIAAALLLLAALRLVTTAAAGTIGI